MKSFRLTLYHIINNVLKQSFKTILFMLKIIIPVTFLVTLLKYLKILHFITFIFEPFMQFFGLSGDAALVLITSNLINIYGGLAVMTSLSFTVKEVTILGVMILFSHSLLVECAIIKGLHVSVKKQLFIRILAAILSGIILNLLIGQHYNEVTHHSIIETDNIPDFTLSSFSEFWFWFQSFLTHYFTIILDTVLNLAWIITAVLFGLEVLKEFKILDKLNHIFYYGTRYLGLSKKANASLLIGLFIGITYGAGAILVHYKEGNMTQKDVTLVTTFLLLCHAIIEDVFLFIRLGAVPWILLSYKIIFTIIVVWFYNRILKTRSLVTHQTN